MKKILLLSIALLFASGIFAQEFEVPKDYKLVIAEDYAPYEQDIIKCVDWLTKTPLNEQTEKRKEANAFLLKWIEGSPNVLIEIKGEIITFMGSSPDLLMIFLGGWTKYSLESRDFENKVEGNMAGLEAIIDFYIKNKKIMSKDKNVEKYIKMKKNDTLKAFVEQNV